MAPGVIGLFDSGVGGLTVAEEVFRILPGQQVVYYGDTANVPYGGRPAAELITFADRIISFLCARGARYIVFACNTSSAVSLDVVRQRFDVPMMGLIEPGAAEAVRVTLAGRIGLIATAATIETGAYETAINRINPRCRVFSRAAPHLVPLVESGELDSPRVERVVREYLEPLRRNGIDTLILGCTHYPFLRKVIARVLGPGVRLVDPAEATVRAARLDMLRRGMLGGGVGTSCGHSYFVSGEPAGFREVARKFLGYAPEPVSRVTLPAELPGYDELESNGRTESGAK